MKQKISSKKKILILAGILILAIMAIIGMFLMQRESKISKKAKNVTDPELARAMTYDQVQEGEEATNSDYVKFDAFFLRDLNGDGIAEGVRGTCREVGKEDTLYMELNVLTDGYLKDGVITINGSNFYLQTVIPKDNQIKESAISYNTKQITLNEITNGTQKLLTGTVNSGNYAYTYYKTAAIGNNLNNMSKINSVVLTGTHVADDGTETQVSKEVKFYVDWYGKTYATIPKYDSNINYLNQEYEIKNAIDSEKEEITFSFNLLTAEIQDELLLKSNVTEMIIPELNGYSAKRVEVESLNGVFEYDESTRKLVITKEAKIDSSGNVVSNAYDYKKGASRYNRYKIKVTYPLEAYLAEGENLVSMDFPISTYFEGYNNQNEEFTNPYKSNVATDVISVVLKELSSGDVIDSSIDVTVGNYYYNPERWVVSKEKPLNLYNGYFNEDEIDTYLVKWYAVVGTNDDGKQIVLTESKDEKIVSDNLIRKDGTRESMNDFLVNTGIYFSNPSNLLGTDGWIRVYDDETDELIVEFTKENWKKYNKLNPYVYEIPVKHIRIETSEASAEKTLYVYNIKQIDDEYLIENYSKEEFMDFKYIESSVVANFGSDVIREDRGLADYESDMAVAKISLDPTAISTQVTEKNQIVIIDATSKSSDKTAKWKDGVFLVKVPDELIDIEINDVTISNDNVQISNFEIIENDNGKFVKIITKNDDPESFKITLDLNVTADPRIPTTTGTFELYAISSNVEEYRYSAKDIYDINDNGNVEELINKATASYNMVSPNSLLTNQIAKNYDDENSIAIAPQIAMIGKDQREATIEFEIKNNYSSSISDIVILGKIPSEGNTYSINGNDLGSTFSTTMSSSGIEIPAELQQYVEIYYSENANPTKDLSDENNGWIHDVTDFSNIKSYLIVLKEYVMPKDEVYKFSYKINIPEGIDYNEVAYSHHGIYFSLDTAEGKYRTQTEPNKLGFMISREYDLEIVKYRIDTENTVSGATYTVVEDATESGKTRITDASGIARIPELYVGRTYTIKEIRSPEGYALNEDEIKFRAFVDDSGELQAELISGTLKNGTDLSIDNGVVRAEVEDEIAANIKIKKQDLETNENIAGVRYKIEGKGLPTSGKIISTDANGSAELKGLVLNEEYVLQEIKATGYYLNKEQVKFKIVKNGADYELQIVEGTVDEITEENTDIPTFVFNLKNQKIPLYDLKITKLAKENNTPLVGAKFKIYKDGVEVATCVTDSAGECIINDLYADNTEFEDIESGEYLIKEIVAPDGYAAIKDFEFKVEKIDGNLVFEELGEESNDKQYTVDGSTINLIIYDSPSFSLVKKDGTTKEVLPGVKFAIYNIDNGEEEARDSKGNIIGNKEVINGTEYYVVTTDENGEINANLPEGIYKAVELWAPDQYDISEDNEYYFGIGASRDYVYQMVTTQGDSIDAKKSLTSSALVWNPTSTRAVYATSDDGFIYGGYFQGFLNQDGIYYGSEASNINAVLKKVNKKGEVEWISVWDSTRSQVDKIIETSDGGYLVAGTFEVSGNLVIDEKTIVETVPSTNFIDSILVKYNEIGEVEWYNCLGTDVIYQIEENDNGEYVLLTATGMSNFTVGYMTFGDGASKSCSYFEITCDLNGNEINREEYKLDSKINIFDIKRSIDNGIVILGNFSTDVTFKGDVISCDGGNKSIILKYDSTGVLEWYSALVKNTGDRWYKAPLKCLEITSKGEIIVGGAIEESISINGNDYAPEGTTDGILITYDYDGNIKKVKTFGATINGGVDAIRETKDGGLAVHIHFGRYCNEIGNSYYPSSSASSALCSTVIKYNENNEIEWIKLINNYNDDEWFTPPLDALSENEEGDICVGVRFANSAGSDSKTIISSSHSVAGGAFKIDKVEIPNIEIKGSFTISGTSNDSITKVIKTIDGGYIACGYFQNQITVGEDTIVSAGSKDGIVIKYTENNEIEWYKTFASSSSDEYTSAVETNTGEYYISYVTGSNAGIEKYDSNGNLEWQKLYSSTKTDTISKLVSIGDNGCVILGKYNGSSFVSKFSDTGIEEWRKNLDSTYGDIVDVAVDKNDNIILATGSKSSSTSYKKTLMRLDSDGNIIWSKDIDISGYFTSITVTDNNDIICCFSGTEITIGEYHLKNSTTTGFIAKFNSDNEVAYVQYTVADPIVASTVSGGYVIIGRGSDNANNAYYGSYRMLFKYKSNGTIDLTYNFKSAVFNDIDVLNNGSIVIGGQYSSNTTIVSQSLVNAGGTDGFVLNLFVASGANEIQELEIENRYKEFTISTEVRKQFDVAGGTISGDGKIYYEKVKYGENSVKEIKMVPNEGYEISSITVNAIPWEYVTLEDGSYVMPNFENMTEDKHIVVTYVLKNNKITINKIDSVSGEKISGAKIKIDQIEEREVNEEILGALGDNALTYDNNVLGDEVTEEVLGEVTTNGTYYFVEQDGKYISTNTKEWQLANGGTGEIKNTTANSYVAIDLTDKTGNYAVQVNGDLYTDGGDMLIATVDTSTSAIQYYTSDNRFMYVTDTAQDVTCTSHTLVGGKIYYLHLAYYENSSTINNDNKGIFNDIKVYEVTTESTTKYNFVQNGNTYTSTNQGISNSICTSYIPIDLTNTYGTFNLSFDYKLSAASGDYGTVHLKDTPDYVSCRLVNDRVVSQSGTASGSYSTTLESGKIYYLCLNYTKANSLPSGEDAFAISNFSLVPNETDLKHGELEFDENGQIITSLPFGKYEITEVEAPDGYLGLEEPITIEFREDGVKEFNIENEKKAKITIHHYIKGTETKVAEDEIKEGKTGTEYTTEPLMNLKEWELAKDENGEYIIPENANGTYTSEEQEIIYYYEQKEIPVLVHHYIEGTSVPVSLKDGTSASDETFSGKSGETYTTNAINSEDLSGQYELVEIPDNASGVYGTDEIIVTYYYKEVERQVVIQKVDEDGITPLEGIKFKLIKSLETLYDKAISNGASYEYVDYEQLQELDKQLVANGTQYENVSLGDEVIDTTDIFGSMTNSNSYYFVEQDGKYIPTNGKTYQVSQGGSDGIHSTTANSYVKIDLSDKTGTYAVVVNASVSSESSYDCGYATISQSTTVPSYSTTTGRFMYISGSISDTDYSTSLEGGKVYYLHLGYRKDGSVSRNEDQVVINSIKLYNATAEYVSYNFEEIDGAYVPNNINKTATVANSYIPIDLRNKTGRYALVVNAESQITGSSEYLYATLRNTTTAPSYSLSTGRFVYLSGTSAAKDYVTYLNGGSLYYLHLGYKNNTSTNNVVKFNSINLYKSKYEDYSFDEVNGKLESNNQGMPNTVANSYIEIDLSNVDGAKLKVNAEISSQSGADYGYVTITENTTRPSYDTTTGRLIYISGEQPATDYEIELEGGKKYYLHLGYRKDGSTDAGEDKFTINSIIVGDYVYAKELVTDKNGEIKLTLPYGEYELIETTALENYVLPETATKIQITKELSDNTEFKIVNEKKKGNIIVHHYLKGTTEKVKLNNGLEAPDVTVEGSIGDTYITKELENVATAYRVVEIPENSSGTYIDGTIEITYYYELANYPYVVNYLEKGTNKVLYEQKQGPDTESGTVINSVDEKIDIDGYVYDSVDKDTLTISENVADNEINIYYTKRNDLSYTVNYLEKDDDTDDNNNKVVHAPKIQDGAVFEDVITSSNEVIEIDGYIYDSVDKDTLTIGLEENEITIYYTKRNDLSYTVNYLEKDTNKVLHTPKTQGGMTFEDIVTSADEVIEINGYNYDSVDKETLTIGTGANEINIYYTKRNDLSYTVNYLEKDTNKVLHEPKTQGDMTFDDVINAEDEVIAINGYKYDSADKTVLTITTGTNEINLYYTKVDGLSYTVNYLEKDTNKVIKPAKTVENQVFETEILAVNEIVTIDGYNYDSVDKDSLIIGTVVEENVINIYYIKRSDLSYTVNYLEKDEDTDNSNNKVLLQPKVVTGVSFEDVINSEDEKVDIDGYVYDSVDKVSLTIGTGVNEINIFYTKRNDLSYTVNYLEKGTNKVLHIKKTQGGMTFEDTVDSSKEIISIDGYIYDSVDKVILVIGTDVNEINIYYTKRADLSYTVNYLEKDTGKVLSAQKVVNNVTFEDVITSADEIIEIDGYDYDSVDKETLTITTGENIINIYYVKRNDLSYTVNYLEKDTNKVLHAPKTQGDMTFEDVVTASDEIIEINGYNYDSVDKETLTITTGENVINIYYIKRNDLAYTVNYLEKDTNNVIYPAKVVGNQVLEAKINSSDEVIEIEGYNYDSVDKPTLTITTGENVINIYYTKRSDLSYKVNYLEKDTNEVLHAQKVVGNKTFKEVINSQDEVIEIDGYNYDSVDKDTLEITTGENVINIYYTKRTDLSYKVNYLEKDTNEILSAQKVQRGMTFKDVVKAADEVIDIDGYNYDSVSTDELVITTGENVINIYYTKRTDLSYKVNYLEKDTDKVLSTQKVVNNVTFETVITSADEVIRIDGYNYDSVDKETLTIGTGENVINIYYTKRNDLSYKVNYLEKDTDKVLSTQKVVNNVTFEAVITSADEVIVIDGYNYDSVSADELVITTGENVINIYYTKKTDLSYTVNYLEAVTGKVLSSPKVVDNQTFGTVITSSDEVIDITGYNYDYPDKETLTIGTGENVINIYYSKVTGLSYVVNYLEKGTDKVLFPSNKQSDMTFEDVVKSEDEIIEIDGYNYDSVDKDELVISNVIEENVINIYYTKRDDLSYKVNYLEKDTDKVLSTQKVVNNVAFETVITSADEVIEIDGYNYDSVDKETLTIGTGENVINIYYTKRTDLSYKVNYLEKDTNKVLSTQKVVNNITFEAVITSADEVIEIDGYDYDSVDKETLTITTGENVINIYYTKKTDLSYSVNYLEKDTNKVLNAQKVVNNVTFETVITSANEVIEIDGYNYDSVDKETLTITAGENVINIYYTKRTDLIYKVNYLEKDTNEILHEQKIQGGMTFEDVVISADEIIEIDGYIYDSVSTDELVITTGENVINIYYTKREDLSYTVNYLEKDTNKILHAPKVVGNKTFKDIVTSADEVIAIDGYIYDSVSTDELVITTGENVINIYYTKRNDLSYTVNYLEKDTNEMLHASKVQAGMTFEDVVTASDEVISIDGYDYDSVDKEVLTISTGENVINIYYTKRSDLSYTVNYLEKDTNKALSEQKVQNGMTFKDVVNSSDEVIEINGYDYDSVDKDTLTITTGENVINIYYVKRSDLSYKVNYLEKYTNKVLSTQKVVNNVTFEDVITSADEVIQIDGYNYDSVDKETLTIGAGENVINIYYTKRSDLSYKVNYLEKDTNKVLSTQKVVNNVTFETVITSVDEVIQIDGYNYDSVDKETLTIGTGENVINIYYVKCSDLSYKVNYLEKDSDKVLNPQKVVNNVTFEAMITSADEVIEIDGYNYDSADKDTLTITTGENVINLYYTKVEGLSYTVNYLEKDTNEVVHPAKITGDQIFDTEILGIDEIIEIDGYNYDSVDKESIKIGTDISQNVINIYYVKRSDLSYKVNYLEKDTNEILHAQKIQAGMTFKDIVTSSDEIIDIDGYNYDSVSTDELVITTGDNVINIYYTKRNDLSYKVNYLEKDTDKVLSTQKVVNNVTFETVITSADEVIAIDGYNYDSVDKETLIIGTGENVINIYYVKRSDLNYKVNYLEKNTNKVLSTQKVVNNVTFEDVITSADEVIEIDGYNYDSVDKETLIIATGENIINIYYTKKTDLSYKVNYLEKDTNKVLNAQKVVNNVTFEAVITSADEVIAIDGYNYDSVDKDTLTITTGENVINIYYTKRTDLSYTVNYLEAVTGKVLSSPKVVDNQTFGTVITSSNEVIDITGYNYDYADKATLTIGTGENVINIYYSKVTGLSYVVNYLEKGTDKVLFPSNKQSDMTFEDVVKSEDEIIEIDGYNYDSVDKEELVISNVIEDNVINIYYTKRNDLSYTVNYLEKDTNEVLHAPKTQGGMTFEAVVTASEEVIEIDGYNYDSVSADELVITTGENVINVYYVKRSDLSYKVNYLEKDTNKVLHEPKTQGNMTFGAVVTSSEEVIEIDGYNYDSVDKETLAIGTGENVINIYYTKKIDLSYKVNYLEKDTNKVLNAPKVVNNVTFETVITSADEIIEIDGYNYDSVDKNTLTITTGENVINIYYIKRSDLSYKVNYLEKDTNKVLSAQKVVNNVTFESVITSADEVIQIDGYNYDSVDKETLTITTGENIINIYYTKRTDLSYKVNYLEKSTNKIIYAQKTQGGMTFEDVVIAANEVIEINGYKYDSVDKETLTIGTGENVLNIYYTKVNGLSYVVNYLEKDTDKVLSTQKVQDGMTFEDVVIASDEVIEIDGYNYDSVDKETLTIGTGENVINIYYVKRTDLSYKVNYLEKDTNKVLSTQKVVNNVTFEDVITSADEIITINGYNYDSVSTDELVITTGENIINIYYTKRTDLSYKVNYLEKDTNKVLKDQKVQDGMTFEDVVKSSDEVVDIFGYNFDSADKDTLIITTSENVINLYYTKKDASVLVHHYLEGTDVKVAEDVLIEGKVSDEYTTTIADDLPSKYEIAILPTNAEGTMTEEQIVVIYYYKLKSTKVIVHHYEEGTTNKLSEDVEIEGLIDSSYTTVPADDVPIKYALVVTPANANGIMTEEVIEVTYYYAVRDAVLNIYYVEKGTDIELAKPEQQTGKVGENYRTDAKVIDGYTLVEHSGNTSGQLEVEPLTIIYYYLQNTQATVQYIDKTTGNILEQRTQTGLVGDEFVTEAKTFTNYILVEEPAEKTVNMTKEEIVLKYYYVHVSAGVIEQHIDVINNDVLYNEVHDGNEGDEYNIPSRIFTGYDLVEDRLPANATGTMTINPITVTYYYIYKTKVTTKYIDKTTGEELTDDIVANGHEGDYYTTEVKDFEGYKLVQIPENSNGQMTKEDITVTYYYVPESAGVIERHLDVLTDEPLAEERTYTGYAEDPYETSEQQIPGYDLVKERYPENAKGKMTKEQIVVTYYYSRKTQVNVKYVDKITGQEIETPETIDGHKGDTYTTTEKQIPGYDLVEVPENATGTMTEDVTEVIYYYIRPTKVIVNYYDIDTKEIIAAEEVIDGHEQDEYTTIQKDIKYYNLVEVPSNATGNMTVEDIRVDYYYKKKVFNLKVDKQIQQIAYNGQILSIDGDVGKIELNKNNITSTDVLVTYEIKVMNTGELRGGAELVENIPAGMTMSEADNPDWVIHEDTATLNVDDIEPGQERSYLVVMRWAAGESNLGMKENIAQIVKVDNEAGFEELTIEDNEDTANFVITIKTGLEESSDIMKLALIAIFAILGVTATFIIKKEHDKKN
ncbi:MAG: MucBP domain-containing protein [Bacilli bacterium]